jgi:cyclopropane-fatty-acyl-phospholipid synthase
VDRVRALTERRLEGLPWSVHFEDWRGRSWGVGQSLPHWSGQALAVKIYTEDAGRSLLAGDILGFLRRFLAGEVDLEGNLYVLSDVRAHAQLALRPWQAAWQWLRSQAFQSPPRARVNVRTHYDIPQEALDLYLDRTYRSYSCAMFEVPEHLERAELLRAGAGKEDAFDSLEKAQWRKFDDAVAWLRPEPGHTLLDIGCGYGGQLAVALERGELSRVVGWTHSGNQVREGSRSLARFGPGRFELHEGDYRSEQRVFDHVTSTGMVSHVGPRGLRPYAREVRRRIRRGGRYLHHALMTPHSGLPLDFYPGTAFHKRYVWPGYHWFTLGQHVRALERSGFELQAAVNLSRHYAKTTAAWYERLMASRERAQELLGERALRAWRLYLAGSSGNFLNKGIHVYRLYCEAV